MLKRFVTYIYQYDRGNRGPNVGFVKADIRDAGCRMEIQLRGLDRFQGKSSVYLIVSGEKAIGIPAGEIVIRQGLGQLKLAYARNQLGSSGYSVHQIQAIVILYGANKLLASCWAEQMPEAVLRGTFDKWGETSNTSETDAGKDRPTDNQPKADIAGADSPVSDADMPGALSDTGSVDADLPNTETDNSEPDSDRQYTESHNAIPDSDTSSAPTDNMRNENTDIPETEKQDSDKSFHIPTTDFPERQIRFPDRYFHSPAGDSPQAKMQTINKGAEDAPATVGIADAPASPDEKLIDFGLTSEELSSTELPDSIPANAPEAQPSTEITTTPEKPDSPDLTDSAAGNQSADPRSAIWAEGAPLTDYPADSVYPPGASCPCQQKAPEQTIPPETPTPDPPVTTYKKIAITDIRSSLPKRNWYLCSNSFLIHGFFNYHYLILKTVEYNGQKKCYLGVPGVYEQPERTMAFMFGFPAFEPAHTEKENAQTETKSKDAPFASYETGVFGYWMLQLMD